MTSGAEAQPLEPMRIEGHVFNAETLKPLPLVAIELWEFGRDSTSISATIISRTTDEGGFYAFEFQPFILPDENGTTRADGYAFAFICNFRGTRKVQVMPLYTSLERGTVYERDAYMRVPTNIQVCDRDPIRSSHTRERTITIDRSSNEKP